MWVGAWGLISLNATARSSSKISCAGISFPIILQNMQSDNLEIYNDLLDIPPGSLVSGSLWVQNAQRRVLQGGNDLDPVQAGPGMTVQSHLEEILG